MNNFKHILLFLVALTINSCSVYNFTGTVKIDAKTFQVNRFQNNAPIVQPGIENSFRLKLQEVIQNQTNLNFASASADLIYEGEIVDYSITPMTATANQTAAQNRLTIGVNVRFINKKNDKDSFEKKFSFYHDNPGNEQLIGSTLTTAMDDIYAHITQDIFNESLAKW
jgi:hypothetical protein